MHGHPIEIRVRNAGEVARLSVRDYGVGIDPARQAFVFDRFERAVSSPNYGGLGLGLYIARRIVQAHGGTVTVESEPGQGATFTVTLPWAAPPRAGDRPTGRRRLRARPDRVSFFASASHFWRIRRNVDQTGTWEGLASLAKENTMVTAPCRLEASVVYSDHQMCAVAIAAALSACGPAGGDNTGTAGTGSPGTGGSRQR